MEKNLLEQELSVVTEAGFKNKKEFVEEAVKTYLAARKDVRVSIAAALYGEEKISLGKAVEISGLTIEEFKGYLKTKCMERKTYSTTKSRENILKYRVKSS